MALCAGQVEKLPYRPAYTQSQIDLGFVRLWKNRWRHTRPQARHLRKAELSSKATLPSERSSRASFFQNLFS
jgi:hypothetical protein